MAMKKPSSVIDTVTAERIAIGIAAAAGLITAAAISGLPSTSCAALAETYARAITFFGLSASSALLAAGSFAVAPKIAKGLSRARLHRAIWRALGYFSLALAFYLFPAAVFCSQYNLRVSVQHCYIGSDVDVTSRLHQRLKLAGVFEWRTIVLNTFTTP